MDQKDLLRFGNELETIGVVYGNGEESVIVMFPEYTKDNAIGGLILELDHDGWKELLHQTDTLQVMGLNKVILRKTQRQIEQGVSWNVYRRDSYTCQYCGADEVPLTVDHIVLWEKEGASVEDNLISACRKCNKTRGNMEFDEWLKSDYFRKVHAQAPTLDLSVHSIDELKAMGEVAKKVPLRNTPRNR